MTAVHRDIHTPLTDDGAAPLATALARFQAEMPTVAKTKTADTGTFRYAYADLADVVSAAMPLLTAHGLSFATCPRWTEHGLELVGVLLHSSGESMEGALPIGGNTPQALGSSITYARRYLFGCMTGVVTDADDDGRAASAPAKAPRKRATTPPDPGKITTQQTKLMGALMRDLKLTDRDEALAYVANVVGHPIGSRTELTVAEAGAVIDALQTKGADEFRRTVVQPRTPVDPWAADPAGPPPPGPSEAQESAGPPGPADHDEDYRASVAGEAKRVVEAAVVDVPLPMDPVPPTSDTNPPVRPPRGMSPDQVQRLTRLLHRELGDVASAVEEQALMSAILGGPVGPIDTLTRAQGMKLHEAFDHFRDETWSWAFDPTDPGAVPRVIITRDEAAE